MSRKNVRRINIYTDTTTEFEFGDTAATSRGGGTRENRGRGRRQRNKRGRKSGAQELCSQRQKRPRTESKEC